MKTKESNKGITLIALVITIIVLLILAGVSLSLIGGSDGVLSKAEKAREVTRIDGLEEEANLLYADLLMQKYTGEITDISMADVVSQLTTKGYEIKEVASSGSSVTGITLDNSSISISANGTATIKVTYEGSSDGNQYYAVIDGKNYKMTLNDDGIKIDGTASEITDEAPTTGTLTATSSDESCVTVGSISGDEITLNGGSTTGSATITVSYGSYSETCTVSVVIKPSESSVPDSSTSFSTAYGTIDVIWLSGTSNTVTTTPNAPVLTSNGESMTPVIWDESNNIVTTSASDSNWYSYNAISSRNEDGSPVDNNSSKWANAKTANDSYFVWIPRYAYRITYYSSQTSTTPTGYYDGFGMWNATDGTVKYALDSGVETVVHNGEKYIVHPAFETNLDLGGWSNDLSGFWFAKFEMSGTGTTLASTYGTASTRSQSIGTQYTSARQATYGYTGTADTDGNTSFMNSHMVKNSEWGAVAYLTQSQYGRNGNEITINSSTSYYRGGGSGTAYLTNTAQSTTGNVYGIYDMSGNAKEYVASFDKLGSSSYVAGSSYGLNMTTNAKDSDGNYISTKYITAYSNGTTADSSESIIYSVGKVGDATKEVRQTTNTTNWFADYSEVVSSGSPFLRRGGSYNDGTYAGVFYALCNYGSSNVVNSFRVALAQ